MTAPLSLVRWSTVEPLQRNFESYLAHDAPRLRIVEAHDSDWAPDEYRRRRREQKVFSLNGVYLIFDATSQLQYVGLAMYTFDKRIWGHDDNVAGRWTDAIPFDPAWCFLAPALEFFLIVKLQPPANTTYRQYAIGQRATAPPTLAPPTSPP